MSQFEYRFTTVGRQTWTVPETGPYLIQAWGAQGGGNGGLGGYVEGIIYLEKGQEIIVGVGQRGANPNQRSTSPNPGGVGLDNGGSGGGATNIFGGRGAGGGGGGSSGIIVNGERVLVAGGGGGEGNGRGGHGGGVGGQDGHNHPGSGGVYGSTQFNGTNGTRSYYKGGGGAGYGGGKGGTASNRGGGGGSGYVHPTLILNPVLKTGVRSGDGEVIITKVHKIDIIPSISGGIIPRGVPEYRLNVTFIPMGASYKYEITLVRSDGTEENITSSSVLVDSEDTVNVIVPTSLFISQEPHILKIKAITELDVEFEQHVPLMLFNTPPVINIERDGLTVKVNVDDDEKDDIDVQILLNEEIVYPLTGEYSREVSPFYYERRFFSNEVKINEENVLEVRVIDQYGGEAQASLTFYAGYEGLMFADMNNEFYSTDLGEVLKYLEVGPLMAGTSSFVYPVKLINKHRFKVSNILLTCNNQENSDIYLEFSYNEVPFIGLDKLTYPDIVLDFNDEIIFYVRVYSRPSTLNGGILDVFVKADPVVN